jgi:DNA polymerase III gamma/tau subunit
MKDKNIALYTKYRPQKFKDVIVYMTFLNYDSDSLILKETIEL